MGWPKGKPFSEETKRKLSEIRKGHPVSDETRWKIAKSLTGKRHTEERIKYHKEVCKGWRPCEEAGRKAVEAWKGSHHSIEAKRKISIARMGNKNWNWKGGITSETRRLRKSARFREWRLAVFERDYYTCCSCGERGRVLHPHHLLSFSKFPEYRFYIENGITLCKKCHLEIHKENKDNKKISKNEKI